MTSKLLRIGFIGGGKMAQAMAKGFISAGKFLVVLCILLQTKRMLFIVSRRQFKVLWLLALYDNIFGKFLILMSLYVYELD